MDSAQKRNLVAAIRSSEYYKRVQNEMVDDGYTPHFGQVLGRQLINENLNEEVEHIEIPFKVRGRSEDRSACVYVTVFDERRLVVQGVVLADDQILAQYQSSPEIMNRVPKGIIKRKFREAEEEN